MPKHKLKGGGIPPKVKDESDDELLLTKETARLADEEQKKDIADNFLADAAFLPSHPQHETHVAFMLPEHASY